MATARGIVDEQTEDEGLWSTRLDGTTSIAEAYLQQELRRLHAAVERETDLGVAPSPRHVLTTLAHDTCPCGHAGHRHRFPADASFTYGPCFDCGCKGLQEL